MNTGNVNKKPKSEADKYPEKETKGCAKAEVIWETLP